MFRLFASLYLFVVVSLISLTALLEHTLQPKSSQAQEPNLSRLGTILSHQTGASIESLAKQSGAQVERYPSTHIRLPEKQQQDINKKGFIILHDQKLGAQLFLLDKNNGEFITVTYPKEPETNVFLYSGLFFLLMGLALAFWTWPLWRDIRILERTVRRVNRDGTLPEIHLSPTSSLNNIAKALASLGAQVQELLQSQKELSGAVAHEFRTPISRLKFALAMLDDSQNIDVSGMQSDVNELERLVQEMLDYATLDSVDPGLAMAEIPLSVACGKLIDKLSETSNIQIQLFTNNHEGNIMGDGHFIERAIQNVLGNALKYAKTQVQIHIEEQDNEVIVMIDDDGPGVAKADRARIFEPFFRPDGARSRDKGGAGLGLAIVSRVQKWHKGRCMVEESPLGGARFILSYPK
ncbi:ATP-binding protein [Paraneptunicella aestuarii]|uniref:ATP-binding protein n=1 Tax=Paraneptunicella aestuarii TaxID=2831148 RepID=UPI001E617A08|nr:ATP-binding protein [Paraneptunicella aestuarii]